jgi:hypothetical protein
MRLFFVLLLSAIFVGCGYSSSTMPTKPGTTPVISGLVPNNAVAGGSAVPFEVDGTSFATNAGINFNGVAEATTWVSAGKLTATIPAAAIMNSGTVPVTVTNPGTPGGPYGGGTASVTSSPMNFTIN